jgi:hypothetical protein
VGWVGLRGLLVRLPALWVKRGGSCRPTWGLSSRPLLVLVCPVALRGRLAAAL